MQAADPDIERMLAFAAGDDSAFDGLWDRWASPLLRYLERIVGDRATAEELVQETFLRVHRARTRYEAQARFSTWLYRIATNLALNELKRPQRRHVHAVEGPSRELGERELASQEMALDEAVESRRVGSVTLRELDKLPERQRMALWLSAAEGHSYAEIATILETSEQSVKALVHRGRTALVGRLSAVTGRGA